MKKPIPQMFPGLQRSLCLAPCLVIISTAPFAPAAQTSTNADWLLFSVILEKTNFLAGDKIPITITVSNITDSEHVLGWTHGNPCAASVAKFLITDRASGKTIGCAASFEQQAGYSFGTTQIRGHQVHKSQADLVAGYALTNPGTYAVQAVGTFQRYSDNWQPKITLTTPPVTISISNAQESRPK